MFHNRFFRYSLLVVIFIFASIFFGSSARADGQCYCYTSLSNLPEQTTAKDLNDPNKFDAVCYPYTSPECFVGGGKIDKKYNQCEFQTSNNACETKLKEWKADWEKQLKFYLDKSKNQPGGGQKRKGLIGSLLPECVFDASVQGECRDVTVFIQLAINIAGVAFTIVGSLALAVFIYGGFLLILSEGNADKIKNGTGAMVAAFIGLAVVFGAYLAVRILGEAIGIQSGFNLLK